MNFGGQKAYTAPRAEWFGRPSWKLYAVGLIMCDNHSPRVSSYVWLYFVAPAGSQRLSRLIPFAVVHARAMQNATT